MNNKIVIHISGIDADIARNPLDIPVVIIDFDNYAELPNMGAENAMIQCPKCQHNGSQFKWNAATCDSSGDPDTVDTRIQNAEPGSQFTCPYCFEPSTTEELGLIPTESTTPATEKNQSYLICPKCLSVAENIGGAFVESGEWDGKRYELEADVHRYRCRNWKCGREFFI
ncbi:hypothetical protein [Paenibacillus glucanolyticus]|uniref:hypothetical protein n=1 Tax=Paenibacillus glucanolyticus TaxID=59843 RepID=UPI00096D80B6|nr:hypothetical protein [Paenibacillus glucanolyticus]OMF76792.1 hypothetical protein BK142_14835 [Paenibacillus glucanolyticus]